MTPCATGTPRPGYRRTLLFPFTVRDCAVNHISTFTAEANLALTVLSAFNIHSRGWSDAEHRYIKSAHPLSSQILPSDSSIHFHPSSSFSPSSFFSSFFSSFLNLVHLFQFTLNLVHLSQFDHAAPACNLSPWISLSSLHMKSVPPSSLTHPPHFRHGF
jgi:hypothetical protein